MKKKKEILFNFYLIWQVKHEQYMVSWQETVCWIIYEFTFFFFFYLHIHIWNSLQGDRADESGKCLRGPDEGQRLMAIKVTLALFIAIWFRLGWFLLWWYGCGCHFNKTHLERTSLFTVQYFFFPKENNIFLVHLLLMMHTTTWWYCQINYTNPLHPRGTQYICNISFYISKYYFSRCDPFGERKFPEYQFPEYQMKFPFIWTNHIGL